MKIFRIIGLCMLISSCVSESNEDINTFVIIGNTPNNLNKKSVILSIQENSQFTPIDTTVIEMQQLSFNGKLNQPVVANIRIKNTTNSISFFMEKDSVFLDIHSDDLSQTTINGSEVHNEYLRFIAKNNEILNEMKLYFPLLQKARSENNAKRLQEIHQKLAAIQKKKTNYALQYATNHPNSIIGAFALYATLEDRTLSSDTIEKIFNQFTIPVKKSDFAIQTLIYLDSINAITN